MIKKYLDWISIDEAVRKPDWEKFSKKIGAALEGGNLSYSFSEEEYHVVEDEIAREWRQSWENQTQKVRGRESFIEISSSPSKVWVIEQVAKALGGSGIRVCDMGCGLGMVVLFSQKMGLKAIGVEYQTRLKRLHKELGIDVVYGDFFSMNLDFLKEQDIVYLYQPLKTKYSSLKLVDLISEKTKSDVVILYNGMCPAILDTLVKDARYRIFPLLVEYNGSSLCLIIKN